MMECELMIQEILGTEPLLTMAPSVMGIGTVMHSGQIHLPVPKPPPGAPPGWRQATKVTIPAPQTWNPAEAPIIVLKPGKGARMNEDPIDPAEADDVNDAMIAAAISAMDSSTLPEAGTPTAFKPGGAHEPQTEAAPEATGSSGSVKPSPAPAGAAENDEVLPILGHHGHLDPHGDVGVERKQWVVKEKTGIAAMGTIGRWNRRSRVEPPPEGTESATVNPPAQKKSAWPPNRPSSKSRNKIGDSMSGTRIEKTTRCKDCHLRHNSDAMEIASDSAGGIRIWSHRFRYGISR